MGGMYLNLGRPPKKTIYENPRLCECPECPTPVSCEAWIKYGIPQDHDKIPIYPVFYLLKRDYMFIRKYNYPSRIAPFSAPRA